MNTLDVRGALSAANRRKLSFRNVSNVVVQLLHTIKYSVPVPFSNLANNGPFQPGSGGMGVSISGNNATGAQGNFNDTNGRKVCMQNSSVTFVQTFYRIFS